MIQITGRLPFGLGRFFGTPGPEVPNRLDESIYPMIDIEGSLPERAWVRGETLWHASGGFTAGVGNSPVFQIFVPTGAGIIAIIEKLEVMPLVGTGTPFMNAGQVASSPPVIPLANMSAWARDHRQVTFNGSNAPTSSLGIDDIASASVTTFHNTAQWQGPPTLNVITPIINSDNPLILVPLDLNAIPTAHYCLVGIDQALASMVINISWRERPVERSELVLSR